jgi:hypothetical protein
LEDVINDPPDAGFVAAAAVPLILIPQVPDAPVPVKLGISVPMARPRAVLAAEAVVAPVPPFAIVTAPLSAEGLTPPELSKLLAKFARFTA